MILDREKRCLVLHKFSRVYQFLSVIEISIISSDMNALSDTSNLSRNLKMSMRSTSSSWLPAWMPLGWIFGIIGCLIPFDDYGINEEYLRELLRGLERTPSMQVSIIGDAGKHVYREGVISESFLFFFTFILSPVALFLTFLLLLDNHSSSSFAASALSHPTH